MKRRQNGEPSFPPGTRPPEYVLVLAAADWVKERCPANRFNLHDALRVDKDLQPDPQPDLEAEP